MLIRVDGGASYPLVASAIQAMHPVKADMRSAMVAVRDRTSDRALAAASRAVCERLMAVPELSAAGQVLAFWPMVDRRELDIRPVIRALAARGTVVGLPIVRSNPSRLDFGAFAGDAALVPGPFGTLEPPSDEGFDLSATGAVIVPALAATREGWRLGYGGGYYDRFLALSNAFSVIPLMSRFLVDSLPVEPHDRPVAAIVTELEEIRTASRA